MDELAALYHSIGAALWYVQHLEDALVNFLTMKEIYELRCARRAPDPKDSWDLLAKHRKQTIGPLFQSCKERKIIKKADHARYDALRDERHWLVHRCMVESGDDLYLERTRIAVFQRVQAIEQEASELYHAVAADLETWASAHGVDVNKAEKVAIEEINRLKGL